MPNIADLLARQLARPDTVLYRHCPNADWRDVTAGELSSEITRWQRAFRKRQLVAGDRIVLCARNGPTWVVVDLAALGLGLVVVPLYVDDNAENVAWCAANAEARLVVVENARLAHGLRKAATKTGALAPMVVLRTHEPLPADDGPVSAGDFLPPAGGEIEIVALPDATLATICYTSGTSGRPKGVMLSHGNILANVAACRETGMAHTSDRFRSEE